MAERLLRRSHYSAEPYNIFAAECEGAGMVVTDYPAKRKAGFYDGPAVETNEDGWPRLQDVIRATSMPLQWDNLGLDFVVYPA
jgi:hypothetical protein